METGPGRPTQGEKRWPVDSQGQERGPRPIDQSFIELQLKGQTTRDTVQVPTRIQSGQPATTS